MLTTKPRITITVTSELEQILAVEQRLHPDLSPSAIEAMLVRRGHLAGGRARRGLVEAIAGGEYFPADNRESLRDEWPQ